MESLPQIRADAPHYSSSTNRTRGLVSRLRWYNRRQARSSLGGRPPVSRVSNICGQYTEQPVSWSKSRSAACAVARISPAQMKTRHVRITIAPSRAAVWHVLLDDAMFRQWAASFAEGFYAEGDWSEGGTIRFLTPGGNGMLSVVAENRPPERVSIKPIGVVNQGIHDPDSDVTKGRAPAYENSTLKEIDGGTELTVDMDVLPEYEGCFADT